MQGITFTFLSQDTEDDADSTLDEHSQVGAVEEIKTNPWQPTAKLPYDSSDDDDDDDAGDDVDFEGIGLQSGKATSQLDELFFFHPGDPELENRINGKVTLNVELFGCLSGWQGSFAYSTCMCRYQHTLLS